MASYGSSIQRPNAPAPCSVNSGFIDRESSTRTFGSVRQNRSNNTRIRMNRNEVRDAATPFE